LADNDTATSGRPSKADVKLVWGEGKSLGLKYRRGALLGANKKSRYERYSFTSLLID
jgi:hypothetical protein